MTRALVRGSSRLRRPWPIVSASVVAPLALSCSLSMDGLGSGGQAATLDDPIGPEGSRSLSGLTLPEFSGPYILGADISSVPEQVDSGSVFVDTDGREKNVLSLLGRHGFNYVRLRTFVEPLAPYGYASSAGGCREKSEAYNDLQHVVDAARAVKAEGMRLLLNPHYSDTWADPGKQLIPRSFRDASTIEELAERVRSYTLEVMTALAQADATPDMVQIGNEITPGFLIHEPTLDTDCYGHDSVVRDGVNGSTDNFHYFVTLLSAAIDGVRQLDDKVEIMLHIDRTDEPEAAIAWAERVLSSGVDFDVLGLSAYPTFQGPVSAWKTSINRIAERLPMLSLAIAEYNPERRLLNDVMRGLPDGRGRGTFFWEPTRSGEWGTSLFDWVGNRAAASSKAFAELDGMRDDYGL